MKFKSLAIFGLLMTACEGGGGSNGNTPPVNENQAPVASFMQSCSQLASLFMPHQVWMLTEASQVTFGILEMAEPIEASAQRTITGKFQT